MTGSVHAPPRFDPKTLPIAGLGRPHGTKGEIGLWFFNPDSALPGRLVPPFPLFIERNDGLGPKAAFLPVTVVGWRSVHRGWLVRFAGMDDRQSANALAGSIVRIDRSLLPPLSPGEYYPDDLPGCAVVDEAGTPLGVVTGVFSNGAHPVLSIAATSRGGELLVPAVPGHLLRVDVPARLVVVRVQEAIEVRV